MSRHQESGRVYISINGKPAEFCAKCGSYHVKDQHSKPDPPRLLPPLPPQ